MALLSPDAAAHAVGLSRGDYRVEAARVEASLVFTAAEIVSAVPEVDRDRDGAVSRAEIDGAIPALDRALVQTTQVDADGRPCPARIDRAAPAEGDAVQIDASFACDHAPDVLSIDAGFIDRFAAGHRHLATIATDAGPGSGPKESSFILTRAHRLARVAVRASSSSSTFGALLWLGITHIWTGYDHLAFLFGLILLGGRARTLAGVITAFTAAHSITLALAALRVVVMPPSFVEPAIALSIAYVGIENLGSPDPARRWRITFPFGLVHGFGFAGALTELGLPPSRVPIALFAFNAGVEIGQLAVLAVALPLVWRARRHRWFRVWGVRIASIGLAVAGGIWFVLRLRA